MNNHCRIQQYTINAQYAIITECPTNKAQGRLKGNYCMKSMGRLPGLSILRPDGSWIVRQGGWTPRAVANGNSRGAIRLKSTQVLMMARQGGWTR
jgi:hypothetical protein